MNSIIVSTSARLRALHDRLSEAYGAQRWWPAQSPFEVVLGAYLTQNTSWKSVVLSLDNLREANALSVDGLRSVPLNALQELIRPSGFQTRKAPALKAFVALLDAEFGGSLDGMAAAPSPVLRSKLLDLPGVGPETADAILLYALGHAVPVADEYLRRIVERHRLLTPPPGRNRAGYNGLVELTERAFAYDRAEVRARLFNEFHALTVAVGKAHCGRTARCEGCPLEADRRKWGDPLD